MIYAQNNDKIGGKKRIMKFYPCIVADKSEFVDVGITGIEFRDGKITDRRIITQIEDYFQRPVIRIRESTANDNEIFIFVADGYVQYNRITNRRTTVLQGDLDPLKTVLTDIINENPDENPWDIFNWYSYDAPMVTQLDLRDWMRDTYGRRSQ